MILVTAQAYLGLSIKLVAPLSSDLKHLSYLRPVIIPDPINNLRELSAVMVDVLIAVPNAKFGRKFGDLSRDDLARVDAALVAVLGLTA
ncbi:type II toxin-antitoxin system PemK/MazF family toxin [uncultured Sphingomonas sp.]|uniref:type II toxin-antitoxin system PemK/MazF family toxin n=1 Tax=uncultured Sphingomonas sp. TaxID=158754 RepID=UPI0035CADA62